MNRESRNKKEIMKMHKYIRNIADKSSKFKYGETKEMRVVMDRCERYMYYYEDEYTYIDWYEKIKKIEEKETSKSTDYMTDVLRRHYQIKASFLFFQRDRQKEFEDAFFCTTPPKEILKLWKDEFEYSNGKDKKPSDRDIYRYLIDSMNGIIEEIKGEDIESGGNDIFFVRMKKEKVGDVMIIEIEYPDNVGADSKKEYKLLVGDVASVWRDKVFIEMRRRANYGSFGENDSPKIVFDFEGKNNIHLTRIMRYIAWIKPDIPIYKYNKR